MKVLLTSKFNPYAYKPLNDFLIERGFKYVDQHKYEVYYEDNPLDKTRDASWRQIEIIAKVLNDPTFKHCDIIANTGQRNIVTNLNIRIEDKVRLRMTQEKNLILNSWHVNHKILPAVFRSESKGGDIKVLILKKPYLMIGAE